MKKFITLLVLLIFANSMVFAATPVDFIYINGSNTNDAKSYNHFLEQIAKFHPVLKTQIEGDAFTYEHLLKNGQYEIEEKPSNYFWGYKSQEDLMIMKDKAHLLQGVSPIVAYAFRNVFAGMLHDAIWVRNSNNMIPILMELDKQVKEDAKLGKKVVLLGYSAGTFITLEYMISKAPYINIADWFKDKKLAPELYTLMDKNPRKNTCTSAFVASDLVHTTPFVTVVPNTNKEEFKKAYMDIDKYTDMYCAPKDTIVGIINYASPIPLFYSDLNNPKTDINNFMARMLKVLMEKDFFFLTVNFADDFLGFPNNVNYSKDEMEKVIGMEINNPKGFFYDYSKTISFRTVAGAHTSYWSVRKRFAKAIVKAYTEGYNFHYGTK